ncbi:hypothetical protein GRF29_77g182219 [Pseudopithomyces chartarum]|uniref:Uncharacterized protein n=1 Tax=Pseudopithomyces chartarum TaxID=1892770 RepID=A0AAN6RFH6_9PLEO|nr:hypothetical protein GRF29_77g182219 [Pseudopithomyces chartarum]
MATLPTPPMHPSNAPALALAHQHATEYPETGPSAKYPPSPGLYMRHLLQEKVVTFGAANTAVVDVLNQAGLLCKDRGLTGDEGVAGGVTLGDDERGGSGGCAGEDEYPADDAHVDVVG